MKLWRRYGWRSIKFWDCVCIDDFGWFESIDAFKFLEISEYLRVKLDFVLLRVFLRVLIGLLILWLIRVVDTVESLNVITKVLVIDWVLLIIEWFFSRSLLFSKRGVFIENWLIFILSFKLFIIILSF